MAPMNIATNESFGGAGGFGPISKKNIMEKARNARPNSAPAMLVAIFMVFNGKAIIQERRDLTLDPVVNTIK